MTPSFPSVEWFRALAERMAAQPEKYRRLGSADITLLPRVVFPDGHAETYRLVFHGYGCTTVDRVDDAAGPASGRHPVLVVGDYAAWREMVENIRTHGKADLTHTLNYLTLPDWPLCLQAADETGGQLDVDRFYRYNETLQSFFDEAAAIETIFPVAA